MEQHSSPLKKGGSDFIEFVKMSKIYLNAIRKNIIWILFAIAITSGINLFLAIKKEKIYQCKLTFILDEEQSNSNIDIAALTGFYNLKNSNQSGTSSDRIMKLFQSNNFLAVQLLKPDTSNNSNLANRVLEHYDNNLFMSQLTYIDNWNDEEKEQIKNLNEEFKFTEDHPSNLGRVEKSILTNIIDYVTQKKEPITRISFDEDSGIFSLLTRSRNHDLSIDLTNGLFLALSNYYSVNKSLKYSEIHEINKVKADSLQKALASVQYQLASFEDSNRKLVLSKGRLKQRKLETELQIAQILYGEARKQLQISEYALRRIKPIFQIIDHPKESLKAIRQSKRIALIRGILLGGLACIIIIVGKKAIELELKEG